MLQVVLALSGGGGSVTLVKAPAIDVAALEVLRGPRGLPGAGGAVYTHTQDIALAVWTVPHNLGRYPSVNVTDALGRLVVPDVAYLDENLVQITHGMPLTGFAHCN